ncbi:hypothetical protein UFOVP1264_36 [uncultured Caudovirales phage]|uniref:Terminase n=1 Tax=uncultured Caudovirales phage TaxID=2100421 RepID=A0A6J5RLT3_9CAUD|nr:hypothetical protein UFOVP1264_36 [uncultured Caudovirales phage]
MTVETAPVFNLTRPPTNAEELWWTVKALWGVEIPRVQVCPDHTAPFDAFAEAYFGNEFNWVLWYGSRGTGKSYMLALLALTKAALLEINVTLLGGSMAQSQNIHEHVEFLTQYKHAPRYAIESQIKTQITFTGGNWIRPLPASQKTVRGPHPQMTLLDEIDEMERKIYDAAMGQAMTKPNARGIEVPEMVVASSTWQNPVGTFSSVMAEAQQKGMPIRTWCYREQLKPHGWMDADFIERKRMSVPAEMFRVEYELGEPAGGSRAFDLDKLNKAFVEMEVVDERHAGNDDEWVFEKPDMGGTYAAGADWAKEADMTVIVVYRTDLNPRKIVYLRRFNRKPWPEMIEAFNRVINDYQAMAVHDATGIGNVVHDLVDERVLKFVMSGRARTEMLTNYITAVEQGKYKLARNTPSFDAHKGTTVEEIYNPGRWNAHLADDVAAHALAHHAAERMAPPAGGQGVKKDQRPSNKFLDITPEQETGPVISVGDVRMVDDTAEGIGVFWL